MRTVQVKETESAGYTNQTQVCLGTWLTVHHQLFLSEKLRMLSTLHLRSHPGLTWAVTSSAVPACSPEGCTANIHVPSTGREPGDAGQCSEQGCHPLRCPAVELFLLYRCVLSCWSPRRNMEDSMSCDPATPEVLLQESVIHQEGDLARSRHKSFYNTCVNSLLKYIRQWKHC